MSSFQDLKKAEEEASTLVSEARKERVRKLKLAKSEAKNEIERYKQSQMEKLTQMREKGTRDTSQIEAIKEKTSVTMTRISEDYGNNKQKAVDFLLNAVVSVDISVPRARIGLEKLN